MRYATNLGFGLLLSVGMAGIGCSTTGRPSPVASTEGERMEYRASVLKQKAELVQKGENLIADGRAMVARGNAMKEQGNTLEGQNTVIAGEAKIREGENYLAQADAIELPSSETPVARDRDGDGVPDRADRPRTDAPPSARVPED